MNRKKWVRLDNASNIFLAAMTNSDTKVFRMSAELTDAVVVASTETWRSLPFEGVTLDQKVRPVADWILPTTWPAAKANARCHGVRSRSGLAGMPTALCKVTLQTVPQRHVSILDQLVTQLRLIDAHCMEVQLLVGLHCRHGMRSLLP